MTKNKESTLNPQKFKQVESKCFNSYELAFDHTCKRIHELTGAKTNMRLFDSADYRFRIRKRSLNLSTIYDAISLRRIAAKEPTLDTAIDTPKNKRQIKNNKKDRKNKILLKKS